MTTIRLLSGGAAQGLVDALRPSFTERTGFAVEGEFGAVGAMTAKLRGGAAPDLLILTEALIAELGGDGLAASSSARDVGRVETAIAVRQGSEAPAVGSAEELRRALEAADEIFLPDPQQATAGIHFAKVLDRLGIAAAVAPRLRPHPNGATAMRALASATSARPIGCTQVTEIVNTPGVELVAALPEGYGLATVYTAALCTRAPHRDRAAAFLELLCGAEAAEARRRAGFL